MQMFGSKRFNSSFCDRTVKRLPKIKWRKRSRSVSKPDFTQGSVVIEMINLGGMEKCYLSIELKQRGLNNRYQ